MTVWLAATVIWLIPRLAPGDPVTAMVSRMTRTAGYVENSDIIIEGWKERFGLNDPLAVQYVRYLGNIIRLDFGPSLAYFPTPVSEIIGRALPWTLGLLLVAVTITFVLGNLLGAIMVWTKTPRLIKVLIPLGMVFTSVPSILAALFLLYIFAFLLNWFPMLGAYEIGVQPGFNLEFIGSVIKHGTLPALSIILVSFGYWALGMRGMMITIEGEDYMHLARAKGLKSFYVLYRYMIRNAILPQITAFAITLGTLVSGQILVEYIFAYQGMGTIIYDAIVNQDFAVIQGTSFMIIVMTALAVLIIDLAYPFIDPRISHGGS
ncbi:ABC transporter permease [Phototrophicus methaneseepsis]|uniref:ABC transporter permease n=1 Tax=Phototrophicus methaneseepsis TaxID=2710758 RepID=UPI001E2A6DB9|nr:ABC transporter permease [Phototrophicus methaneseepsis]